MIVGSGFSGIAMGAKLKRDGRDDFVILEKADEVGGTWRENTYPGCRCDVPSLVYSLSFAPNPDWSSTFSPQPEIQEYLRGVATDEGLRPHIRFGCELHDATWDDEAGRWRLNTSTGPLTARVLVAGAGPLHEPSIPDIPGLDEFEGEIFHSAEWNHDHDLDGERVAVIGTGASAIQFVPKIAPRVDRLDLYQRTAPWVMPRRDRPFTRPERLAYKHLPFVQRLAREAIYWAREAIAIPMLRVAWSAGLRRIGKAHLRSKIADPELRRKVTPSYAPGCKRILVANDYLPSLTRENVDVITDGIAEVRGRSIVAADGTEREVDTIILGTGFHVTDLSVADRIRDEHGRSLSDLWQGSPQAYRGTMVSGYPNFFLLLGPNTGLGHNSVVYMLEAQADHALAAIRHMAATGAEALDVDAEVQRRYNDDVQARLEGTVWSEGGCSSYYIDRNGLNTAIWPDFSFKFGRELRRFEPSAHHARRPGQAGRGRRRGRSGGVSAPVSRVLITGAGSGIGAATVTALERRGAEVIGLDLAAAGDRIIACDVTDQRAVDAAVAGAVERLGGLDVLINCAGVGFAQSAGAPPDEAARKVLDVNLLGPWRVTSAALERAARVARSGRQRRLRTSAPLGPVCDRVLHEQARGGGLLGCPAQSSSAIGSRSPPSIRATSAPRSTPRPPSRA